MLTNKVVKEDGMFFVYSKDGKKLSKGYLSEEAANKRLKEIEYFKHNVQNVIFNVSTPNVRHDMMEGREFLVAPMVMLTEGVHQGSQGPLYYPAEELGRTPEVWNHKPIVVYHPTFNGRGVSACDPIILTNRKVGVVMNAKFEEGKLKAEAWLEKSRIDQVDNRISEFLEKKKMMELSTGLFTDNEDTDGEWNGEKYSSIARNYRPDHLALLPDQKGACSIEDGAGLLRNESFNEIHSKIQKKLEGGKGYMPDGPIVYDVFVSTFVYSKKGKYFAQKYSLKDGEIILDGIPAEVERVMEYKTKDGKVIANGGSGSGNFGHKGRPGERGGSGGGGGGKSKEDNNDFDLMDSDAAVVLDENDYSDEAHQELKTALGRMGIAVEDAPGFEDSNAKGFSFKKGKGKGKATTVEISFDHSAISEDGIDSIQSALKDAGISMKDDPRYKDSDTYGFILRKGSVKNSFKQNQVVANGAKPTKDKEKAMNKKELVDALISNASTQWEEADREGLMAMQEDVLKKMLPVANEEAVKEEEVKEEVTEEKIEEPVKNEAKPVTLDGFIAAAPAEIREVLVNSIKVHEVEKTKAIKAILANKANTFKEAYLKTQTLEVLNAMAKLAGEKKEEAVPSFQGMGEVIGNTSTEEPLDLPVVNFSKK